MSFSSMTRSLTGRTNRRSTNHYKLRIWTKFVHHPPLFTRPTALPRYATRPAQALCRDAQPTNLRFSPTSTMSLNDMTHGSCGPNGSRKADISALLAGRCITGIRHYLNLCTAFFTQTTRRSSSTVCADQSEPRSLVGTRMGWQRSTPKTTISSTIQVQPIPQSSFSKPMTGKLPSTGRSGFIVHILPGPPQPASRRCIRFGSLNNPQSGQPAMTAIDMLTDDSIGSKNRGTEERGGGRKASGITIQHIHWSMISWAGPGLR